MTAFLYWHPLDKAAFDLDENLQKGWSITAYIWNLLTTIVSLTGRISPGSLVTSRDQITHQCSRNSCSILRYPETESSLEGLSTLDFVGQCQSHSLDKPTLGHPNYESSERSQGF
ncbi:hypothetical protein FKM82_021542 [Ascaphus truei]